VIAAAPEVLLTPTDQAPQDALLLAERLVLLCEPPDNTNATRGQQPHALCGRSGG
jgi:hypothetical protein